MQTHHRQSGMTLIELMVAVAILGILLAIGIPSMRGMSETEAVRGHMNTFFSTLRYARSEAIRNRAKVVICPSNNSESASPSCATGTLAANPWNIGWIVFVNRDGDEDYLFDATKDTLVRVQGPINTSGGIVKNSGTNKLVYRSTGILLSGGSSSFFFDAVSRNANQKKRVCISLQGRPRVSADTDECGD